MGLARLKQLSLTGVASSIGKIFKKSQQSILLKQQSHLAGSSGEDAESFARVNYDLLNKYMHQQAATQKQISSAMPDYGSPYGQTLIEQEFLLSSLRHVAMTAHDEVELLQCLLKKWEINNSTVTVIGAIDPATIAVLLPDHANIQFIHASELCDDNLAILKLCRMMRPTQHMIVTNAHVASLLLMRPTLMQQLAQKVSGEFIFPRYVNPNTMLVEWSKSFGDSESDGQRHWRWALANADTHTLTLTNNTLNTQEVTISFAMWNVGTTIPPVLKLFFLNESSRHHIHYDSKVEVILSVPPGRHRLIFDYEGDAVQSTHDFRVLHFGVVDFAITAVDGSFAIEKNAVYQSAPQSNLSPHKDVTVRNVLHEAGFFEVNAVAHSLTTSRQEQQVVTRYHVANIHYVEQPALVDASANVWADVICYYAKRCATFREV